MVKVIEKVTVHSDLQTFTVESAITQKIKGAIAPRFVRLAQPWLKYETVNKVKPKA
jgi:hypothetical protein